MTALERTLQKISPRFVTKPIAWQSVAIRAGAIMLFCALLVPLFVREDVFAWSIGIAYIGYDTALLIFTALKIKDLKPSAASLPLGERPSLAIIIAAHNEAPSLKPTIDALLAQSDPPDLILLADDGSNDATPQALWRDFGVQAPPIGGLSEPSVKTPSLRWLKLAHGGKARALNQALPLTEADIVITVDADTILEPGAVAAMRAAFANEPELVAATGVLTPTCHAPGALARIFAWFQAYEYVRNFLSRYAWMEARGLLLISGAFAAFRREAVLEVGGFDPNCLVEDYELIHRLYRSAADQKQDWRIRVIGEARATTDAPAAPLPFLRQRRRWFSGFLETQHWNRDMIGNPRFGALGRFMMPVKTMDTMQPIFGLAAFVILIGFVATGHFIISLGILALMTTKVLIDLCFHLWSLRIYARWTGQERFGLRPALLAVFLEPFTFQLLRHAGAAWGWIGFLTGHRAWGARSRAPQLEPVEA